METPFLAPERYQLLSRNPTALHPSNPSIDLKVSSVLPKGGVLVMALGLLVRTLSFWGSREGFYLLGFLFGMFFRQINQETCGQFGLRGMLVCF